MLKRLRPRLRFVLGMATLIVLLGVTAGLWWWLPAQPFATLAAQTDACRSLRVSQNGQFLLAVHRNLLAVWDLQTRREVGWCSYQWLDRPYTKAIWFSHDGRAVAFGERNGPIAWWTCGQPGEPVLLSDSEFIPEDLIESPVLVAQSVNSPRSFRLWDSTRKQIPLPPGHAIESFQYIGAAGTLVALERGTEDGWLVHHPRLTVWRNVDGQGKQFDVSGAQMPAVISPDSRLLAAIHLNRTGLYDLATGQLLADLPRLNEFRANFPLGFSPDSQLLMTVLEQLRADRFDDVERYAIWDVSVLPPRKLVTLIAPEDTGPLFSPDGRWAAVWQERARGTGTVGSGSQWDSWSCQIFDARTCQLAGAIPPEFRRQQPVFAPDSQTIAGNRQVAPTAFQQWLATILPGAARPSSYEALQVWTIPNGQEIATIPNARCFAYLPNGRSMAVGYEDGRIELWDIPPRRPWYIDYGLPVVFALLVLLAVRLVWRSFRKPKSSDVAPC